MQLYAFYLGGKAEKANIEVHDVVFLVSKDWSKETDKIKAKWFGDPSSVHIDAVAEISGNENTVIKIDSSDKGLDNKLFFINFGGSQQGVFSESHENGFFIAQNKSEAISQAKKFLCTKFDDIHLDNLLDVDDCLEVSSFVDNKLIFVKGKGHVNITTCYKKI